MKLKEIFLIAEGINVAGPSKEQELKWQAEDDARAMINMHKMMQDKTRMKRAHAELARQAQAALDAMGETAVAKVRKGMRAAFPKD